MIDESAIAVIKQQVLALADPADSLNDVGHKLGALWQDHIDAGDHDGARAISLIWERTQEIGVIAHAGVNVARAALQTAVEIADAIPNLMQESYENGLADAEEMIFEDLHCGYGDQIFFDDPASEILDILTYELSHGSEHYVDARDRCTEDDVTAFARYLAGRTPQMTGELAAMVCDFIATFGAEYRRWHADHVLARQAAKSA